VLSRAFCLALVSQWKEECGKQEERQRNIQQVVLCLFKILSERKRIFFASAFSFRLLLVSSLFSFIWNMSPLEREARQRGYAVQMFPPFRPAGGH
jgi:hypothetical protein